ncbi:MAG: hypothetical protein GX045_02705 [Clostridiaceae bacterium]|jgi:hypothetical protein|nr:hypothetical protein [Clostridiaceae bacterium]
MRREELKFSFDQIMTDENDKNRMLNNILKQTEKRSAYAFYYFKKAIPALVLELLWQEAY